MDLKKILFAIEQIAKNENLSRPLIVGGVPRDKIIGNVPDFSDIDITTGDESIFVLAKTCGIKFSKFLTDFRVMNDFHARMVIENFKIDFSSNFKIKNIKEILIKKEIDNLSSMKEELYSRDFICNTLLLSMDLTKMFDLTKQAIEHIQARKIQTCLSPGITFSSDPKRIVRAVYLASKLNFNIEQETFQWMKNNIDILSTVSPSFIAKKINKAFSYNKETTNFLLKELNMWKYIPATKELIPEIQQGLI